jgi:hypothetical protein
MALAAVALLVAGVVSSPVAAEEQTPAQAGEQVGIEGTFVRVALDEEGFLVVGYRIANESVGKEWMLLDVGMTVMKGTKPQTITRDDIKLVTPDHEVLSLPSQEDYQKARGEVMPLVKRAALVGDSINYFPASADSPCSLTLFTEPGVPTAEAMARDEVELSHNRACVGRLYFHVPGGIKLGNYNFDVKFENSIVKVPIEIMTEEQAKEFTKKWKESLKKSKH